MKRGFTLIECICCIAIMTILAGISFPEIHGIFKSTEEIRFEEASKQLLSDLRGAQIRAMTEGRIKISFDDDGYRIVKGFNMIKNVKYGSEITFDRVNSTIPLNRIISFTEIGTTSPYACTISIKDDEGRRATITIKVGTFTIDFKKR